MSLWRKAGQAMGVRAYADGGIVGATEAGGGSPQINLGGINIEVNGASGDVVEAIKAQIPEIANELCDIIATHMGRKYANTPIRG